MAVLGWLYLSAHHRQGAVYVWRVKKKRVSVELREEERYTFQIHIGDADIKHKLVTNKMN